MRIDLNCDMGELADAGVDERIMPYVTSANIACGAHAGDAYTMERTIRLALAAGVSVGAHPGYPDLENFGRVEMAMSAVEIETTVFEQVVALAEIAARLGARVRHVKPHGALYNVAVGNETVAEAIGLGVARWSRNVVLVGLAGSTMLKVWRDLGYEVAAEGFADRRYEPDGTLRPRRFADALITDAGEAGRQAVELAGRVETICIHGDTPGATAIAAAVREALRAAGIEAAPLRG